MKKLLLIPLLCLMAIAAKAKDYINLNNGWRYMAGTVNNGELPSLNTDNWEEVTLPHSWNALDGQDGGGNYRRGDGWYRLRTQIPQKANGKRVYIDIGAACMQTWVYVNGKQAGTHVGGYARFAFDITDLVTAGQEAVIAIRVNNEDIVAPPRSADFTFSGGIQRDVRLIVCEPLHLAPVNHIAKNGFLTLDQGADIASPGVRIRQYEVSEQQAKVDVMARTRNSSQQSINETVVVKIFDRQNNVVAESEKTATINAGQNSSVTQTLTITQPHLWNGIQDPYLYRVEVSLKQDDRVTDKAIEPLGLRYYSVDKELGFFLNGKSYPLRGMAIHEELNDKGRALTDADRLRDLEIMRRSGLNYIRISHYQHGDYTYNYCDSVGIIVWTEIPAINYMSDAGQPLQTYQHHAASQLYELIRQQYNHPSVCFWGLCNEIRASKTNVDIVPVLRALNDLAHNEDPTRLTTLAHDKAGDDQISSTYKEWELPDVIGVNKYVGWYEGSKNNIAGDFETRMTKVNSLCKLPVGMSEYGAGGSPFRHQYPNPGTGGNGSENHPEEFQSMSHEKHLSVINRTPWFWSTSLWADFDFASDSRNEGDQAGINDKGLVTHDRAVTKDAYHLYRANWITDSPVIYICSRRFDVRQNSVPVAVYSNCNSVILKVNGRTYPTVCDNNIHLFTTTTDVPLQNGTNIIEASGLYKGKEVTDHVVWYTGTSNNTIALNAGDTRLSYTAPAEGTYTCRIAYTASQSHPQEISANGHTARHTFGPSTDGQTRMVSVNLYLKKGTNTITMSSPNGNQAPEIQSMTFYFYHDGEPHFYDNDLHQLMPIPENPNPAYNEITSIRRVNNNAINTNRTERNNRLYTLQGLQASPDSKGLLVAAGKKFVR